VGSRAALVVVACHFVASFAALGLPPFFPELLPALGDPHATWAGVLYVVPTVCVALSAPLWGRLADRYGRKRLLLRAQLGLALAFWLAAHARTLSEFTAVLVLQGLLGGTFSASHAYLATALRGPELASALTAMQVSARAALVAAPIAVGLLARWVGPQELYQPLALLPLIAALLVSRLPEPGPRDVTTPAAAPTGPGAPAGPLFALEAAFVFATVISFPYLLVLLRQTVPDAGETLAGLLFAAPHLVYLLTARPALRLLRARWRVGLLLGFGAVAAGLGLHTAPGGLPVLLLARLLLGAGLTAGLVALSLRTADVAAGRPPGSLFGRLETCSKGGAVLAGAAASLLVAHVGPAAAYLLGAAVALLAALALARTPRSAADSSPLPTARTSA
jgi:predicted MFS family arabinose efflux permease